MRRFYVTQPSFLRITFLSICAVLPSLSASTIQAQDLSDRGKQFYEQRHAEADSFRANPTNINQAIEIFEESLQQNIKPEQSATYLLRSYYFKGMYTGLTEDQKKEVYQKGKDFGEQMIEQFPNSVPIKFWYAANLGRWADVHGFVKAATSGISQKLRRICEDIIKNDPQYQGGGGYRILAQVHFYSPHIPIVMGWPSKEKALELVERALAVDSNHPSNRILYAQILLELDNREEARKQLQQLQQMRPRPSHTVEDYYVQHRSRELLEKHFN
ncbi:tetratricopeptide repeat protein [Fodinibius sp. Rm-B-1B1-1]|uniref:tetratricopeptide repeat protein n=1 Tax=Fodinibius alkaliphilus TaxID=3140241 RepID=UPI003159C92B